MAVLGDATATFISARLVAAPRLPAWHPPPRGRLRHLPITGAAAAYQPGDISPPRRGPPLILDSGAEHPSTHTGVTADPCPLHQQQFASSTSEPPADCRSSRGVSRGQRWAEAHSSTPRSAGAAPQREQSPMGAE